MNGFEFQKKCKDCTRSQIKPWKEKYVQHFLNPHGNEATVKVVKTFFGEYKDL